ncbi:MAG: hypothetical protein KAS76_00485 [Thermoplasmatales archaeon]|nr:hypothetical protein [Thermoplasmatales archaeon]MCK5637034.1 hypothetical protein [Thermoplasmatales archaeon]
MRLDRRLILIGVMLVVLSMTMATQYAVTKTGYTFTLVHPSNADIRFIGQDNSSDNLRVLRVNGSNATGSMRIELNFGSIGVDQNKTYTAAFGIVNEEKYKLNLTHVNVSVDGSGSDYIQLWVHGDPNLTAENDATSVYLWNEGVNPLNLGAASSAWVFDAGDANTGTFDGATKNTLWDETSHVQWANNTQAAANGTSDWCWFQISIDAPPTADTSLTYNGQIWLHFRTDTTEYFED